MERSESSDAEIGVSMYILYTRKLYLIMHVVRFKFVRLYYC